MAAGAPAAPASPCRPWCCWGQGLAAGRAGGRRKGRVSPLRCGEVALAPSASRGSCAGLKWSIQQPLPCSSGCPVGWAPLRAQLALLGVAGPGGAPHSPALALYFGLPSPSPSQGCSDAPCDVGWQPGPGPETQKSAQSRLASTAPAAAGTGRYRQWFWGSRHHLWHCQEQRAGLQWPWGWTHAAHADFPGSGREWCLSFPDAELLAKPGTFQSALLPVGFPPGCWRERKQARRQRRAGRPGPAPRPSCPCSGVTWATAGHGIRRGSGGGGQAGAQRRVCRGHVWEGPR